MTRLFWARGAFLFQAVALVGAFYAVFGWEAAQSGANVSGWLTEVLLTVALPLAACLFCVAMLLRPLHLMRR